MIKVDKVLDRANGSQVKIVAQECFAPDQTRSVDVYVLVRDNPESQWRSTSNSPHPDWRKMSVDEYVDHGRSEMLQLATPGEILSVVNELESLATVFEHDHDLDYEAPRSAARQKMSG